MNQSDPTDHALAAIASILDQPEPVREPEKAAVEEKPIIPESVEADGYSKTVSAGNGMFTLLGFMGMYLMLGILFMFLVHREIDQGPAAEPAVAH